MSEKVDYRFANGRVGRVTVSEAAMLSRQRAADQDAARSLTIYELKEVTANSNGRWKIGNARGA